MRRKLLQIDGFTLGSWINVQRRMYNKNKLSPERIKLLESIPGWTWSVYDSNWDEMFGLTQKHGNVRADFVTPSGKQLGYWQNNQRQSYKKGQLSPERIAALEAIAGWKWSHLDTVWDEFSTLSVCSGAVQSDFITPCGKNLGAWQAHQRTLYKKGQLTQERITLLNSIPGWSWYPKESVWNEFFAVSLKFGTVSTTFESPCGYKLGIWQNNQRTQYRKNKLSPDRIAKVESIPGWNWNPPTGAAGRAVHAANRNKAA